MFRDARLAAIADARRRADDYAARIRHDTWRIWSRYPILNAGFGGVREMRAFAMAKGADDASFEFEPAVQTVSGPGDRALQPENGLAVTDAAHPMRA